jgi:energy-converting hydrogenase A subunit D
VVEMTMDFINISTVSATVSLIAAAGIILLPKPIDKVIMFGMLQGGFIGMIVAGRYLDVAMVAALFDPISTIILLIAIIKINDVRKKRRRRN